MVRKATAEALGRNAATAIEIVGQTGELAQEAKAASAGGCDAPSVGGGCGTAALEW